MKLERKVSKNNGGKLLIVKDVLKPKTLYGAAVGDKVIAIKEITPDVKFGKVFYSNYFLPSQLIDLAGLEADEIVRYAKGNDGWFFIFSKDNFNGDLEKAQKDMIYRTSIKSKQAEPPTGKYSVLHPHHENKKVLLDISNYLPLNTKSVLITFRSLKEVFWLEIRTPSKGKKFIPEENLLFYSKSLPAIPCENSANDFTFESKLIKGKFVALPKGFTRRCKELSRITTGFPVYQTKDALIIEAPLYSCGHCGKAIRSTAESKKICLCPDCAKDFSI